MTCWYCECDIEPSDKYVYVANPFDVRGEEGYRFHESCSFEVLQHYVERITEENIRIQERAERQQLKKKQALTVESREENKPGK